jgi:hypothetical protein
MFVEGMVRYQLIPGGADGAANAAAPEIPPAYDEAASPLSPSQAPAGVPGSPPSYGSIAPGAPPPLSMEPFEEPQQGWDGPPKDPYPGAGRPWSPAPPSSMEEGSIEEDEEDEEGSREGGRLL